MIPLIWVNPEDVDAIWSQIAPLIEKAMVRTGVDKSYDVDFVRLQIKAERFQCWVGVSDDRIIVAHVSTIEVKPKRKIFCIPLTGAVEGTIEDWIEHIDVFSDFAKEHGCSTVRGYGRLGWVKKLKPDDVRVEFDIEV